MRVFASILVALWVCAAPALAADKAPADPAKERVIEFLNLALPVVRDGRLENYFFMSVSVEVKDGSDVEALRKRTHIVRDLFLRASHQSSIAVADDPFTLDPAAAGSVLTPAAQSGFGAKAVKELKIVTWTSLRRRSGG